MKLSELEETVASGVVIEEMAKGLWESDRAMVRERYLLSPVGVGGIGIAQRAADVYSQVEEPVAQSMVLEGQGLYDLPALRRCGQGGRLSLQDHSG